MWTFIALNCHQLTKFKSQLNITNFIGHKSIDMARSYERRYRGNRMAMMDMLLQRARF